MTRIYFYVNMPDRMRFLYGLLSRKITPRGWRVLLSAANDAEAERLDKYLWTAEQNGFLPHARIENESAKESPIVIGVGEPEADFRADALVWWHTEPPKFFGRFEHLIEIATTAAHEVQAARQRYQVYQSQGYHIELHDIKKIRDNKGG